MRLLFELRKVLNVEIPLLLPPPGQIHQGSGVSHQSPVVGDEEVRCFYHVFVGSDDGSPFWNQFHSGRIEAVIKARGQFCRAIKGVVGQQKDQRDMWVSFFARFTAEMA